MAEPDGRKDPADLRVSHAEREHVLALLQAALSRGMLDAAEFAERSGLATAAVTRRDLNVLVVDLPVRTNDEVEVPAAPFAPGDVVEMRGWFAGTRRGGDWPVPRKLVLQRRMGSIELDFTEASIPHEMVEIELDIAGGSVELRLPDGASVSTDRVDVILGSVEDHRRASPARGRPHFLITGVLRWGSVELRGPRWGFFRRR